MASRVCPDPYPVHAVPGPVRGKARPLGCGSGQAPTLLGCKVGPGSLEKNVLLGSKCLALLLLSPRQLWAHPGLWVGPGHLSKGGIRAWVGGHQAPGSIDLAQKQCQEQRQQPVAAPEDAPDWDHVLSPSPGSLTCTTVRPLPLQSQFAGC